jgi:16S rRNA (guanine527-N7)-methyltransferase
MRLEYLAGRLHELGMPLSALQRRQLVRLVDELLRWNARLNLVSANDESELEVRHLLDSIYGLVPVRDLLSQPPAASAIDVGSGAGFPGLPVKIMEPSLRLTLVESVAKKADFLEHVVQVLALRHVTVVNARAEDAGRQTGHRERYDIAFARALAALPVVLELCLPFLRVGGRLVAFRRGDLEAEQVRAHHAAEMLGGAFLSSIAEDLGPDYLGYGLVVVEKVRPTPAAYPRRVGIPRKRPL